MYCRHCGKEIAEWMLRCPDCGKPPWEGERYCHKCGGWTEPSQSICPTCSVPLIYRTPSARSWFLAVFLALVLGWLGVHRFYLGYPRIGIAQLLLSLVGAMTCGVALAVAWIWGWAEAFLIANGSIKEDGFGNVLQG